MEFRETLNENEVVDIENNNKKEKKYLKHIIIIISILIIGVALFLIIFYK